VDGGDAPAATVLRGIFAPTGSMNMARYAHTATILGSGKVLVTGGFLYTKPGHHDAIASAELYDPAAGTFTGTGSMSAERVYHTATVLPNGKVLLAGGVGLSDEELASAELYDPVTGRFTPTGSLAVARDTQTATLLPNGQVPTLVFDETTAQSCLDAYAAALHACPDRGLAERTGGICWGMFRPRNGSLVPSTPSNNVLLHAALGEPCMGSCVGTSLTSSTCTTTTAGGVSTTAFCWIEDGVYCLNGTCVALPTVGQACGQVSYCGLDTQCQNQICVASQSTGGKCASSDSCVSADYCNPATYSYATVLANGSACSEDRDCAGGQCERGLCRAWSIATASACAGQID
jgi:hypothetical protein